MESKIKPFLRWAGGKNRFISHLIKYIPPDYKDRLFLEPFLGAGSMFLTIKPNKAILSDINEDLINCFICVKENPTLVRKYLVELVNYHNKKKYYEVRKIFNNSKLSARQAARFIYLNKTSFNGIFRVNNRGEYNVPYGYIKKPVLPLNGELKKISIALKVARIYNSDYSEILAKAKKGNFIYVDPPYPPLNSTSFFNHYSIDRFNYEKHLELSEQLNELKGKNCLILISNADTTKIRKLYKGWDINSVPITRWVSCKSQRIKVRELIIKNY